MGIRGNISKEACSSVSTRSRRGARRRFAEAFERNHVLVSQQDRGEELDEDSRELLKESCTTVFL